jgi:hypothetical protein
MPAVARILSQFDRPKLEGFIAVAIGLLDVLDGDPDEEANGDELDGTCAEDEAGAELCVRSESGPGCLLSDDDSAVDDRNCDDINMDLEPDADAEPEHENWAHWMDHPPELHLGKRTGWNDGPEAA